MTGTRTALLLTLALLTAASVAGTTPSQTPTSAVGGTNAEASGMIGSAEVVRPGARRARRPGDAAAADTAQPVASGAPADLVGRIPPLVPIEDLPVRELVRIALTREWRFAEGEWRPLEADAAAAEVRRRGAPIVPELFDIFREGSSHGVREFLVEIGPDAVPCLLHMARAGDDACRAAAISMICTLASAPAGLGPHAGDVVTMAITALGDGDCGDAAESVLSELPQSVPDLLRVTAGGDGARTAAALRVLLELTDEDEGLDAHAALAALAADASRSPAVRTAAVCGLGRAVYGALDDADLPAADVPLDVRLWALAHAAQSEDPDPDVVRTLRDAADAATALFVAAAESPLDDDIAWDAIDALQAVRPECAPDLMRLAVRSSSAAAREAAVSALGDVLEGGRAGGLEIEVRDALLATLGDPEWSVRDEAAASLRQAVNAAIDVVPGFAAALDRAPAREPVLERLADMGPAAAAAAPRLRALALDAAADAEDRANALRTLACVTRDDAVGVASSQLASPSASVRWVASNLVLGEDLPERGPHPRIDPTDDTCRMAARLLDDADADIRAVAAAHLARADGAASPELLRLATDPSPSVVRVLAAKLERFDPATPGVCEAVLACLASDDSEVRRNAAHAGGDILRACGVRAVPFLVRMITSETESEAAAGIRGIRAIPGAARAATPALVDALFDAFGRLRPIVLDAVAGIDAADAADAVPVLAECFRRGMDASVRGRLREVLRGLGWRPGTADVERLLDSVRWGASPDSWDSGDVFELVARAGPAADVARRLASDAWGFSGRTCEAAIECLGRVSTGEPEVVAFLVASLASTDREYGGCCHPSWNVAAAAARALGAIGPAARDALPALRRAAASDDDVLSRSADGAVAAIAGDGR